jgi:hypothetical protein
MTGGWVVTIGTVTLTEADPSRDIDAVTVTVDVADSVLVTPEAQTPTVYGLEELLDPAGLKSNVHSALPLAGALELVKL